MTPRVWNDWISKFLSARGLQEPDGRALWAYRVSEEEFQEIREIEKKLVWRQFDIPYDDRVMIFTLHAAELWRREYAGGPWTWDILMPHFGMPEDLQDYARQLVGHGARNWKIQTVKNRQGRQYVATLFVNSGLPTQLIAQEHGSKIEELVLKSIQRGFRFPDEADVLNGVEHLKSILPDTLAAQPSFINMIGQWVLAIVSLVRENRLNKATNPILQLNEVEPNWANRLPFEVSGEEMSALLERLLKQSAVYVPEERNFVSSFMGIRPLNKNEWQPVLEFKFLHVVSRSVIKEYIRSDDLTDDYSLYLKGGFGRILLARLISSPFLQHNFEINGQTDQAIRYGSEALSEMSFELEDQFGRTFGLSIDISPFSIGARPALFSERINGPIRLDGYGRVSTEKSEGFIVTHEPLEELNEQTKITPVGYLRGFEEQKVYRIEGSVGVGLGIDRFVIRTGDRSKRAEFFGFFFEDLIDAFDPSVQVLSTESIESNLSRDFDYDWGGSTTSGIGDLRVFDITRSPKELVWKERILRTDGEPSIEVESEGGKQLVRLDNIPYRSVYVENPETQTELVTESIPEGFKFSVDELTVKPVRITLLLEDHKEWSFSIVPRLHGALVTLDNQIVDSCSISQLYSANLNLVMTDYQYYLEDDLTVT
ncbi:STY4851/ECs_5259 family protein, partial [Litorivicinus sp.]|nr:STY4851/ECs_5259 family protein [Litorivicinus sp.]